jgi:hypothetical protein
MHLHTAAQAQRKLSSLLFLDVKRNVATALSNVDCRLSIDSQDAATKRAAGSGPAETET